MTVGTLDVDGARLAFERSGASGPTVVLVHGGFCDHGDWQHQIEALSTWCQVIAPDQRGHGASAVDDPSSCTIDVLAGDLVALLRAQASGAAVLVGHSMAARVVLEAARRAPALVGGVVLVDGSRVGTSVEGLDDNPVLRRLREEGTGEVLRHLFENMFVGRVDPVVRRQVLGRLDGVPAALAAAVVGSSIQWDATELEGALRAVGSPVLAVQSTFTAPDGTRRSHARLDERSPWLDLLAAELADLEIEVVPDVGHFCMRDAAPQVSAALERFVRRVAPGS